jgi:hypothetical protein
MVKDIQNRHFMNAKALIFIKNMTSRIDTYK